MSDVLENDFFANVQNSVLQSPHLAAVATEQATTNYDTLDISSFTRLEQSPVNKQIGNLILQNNKWFFGYSTAGSDVPPTPESRMKGLRNVLMNFEEYKEVEKLSPADLLKKSHYLKTSRDIQGKSVPIDTLLITHHEDAVTDVFWQLVAKKDPLITTLAQLNERHSLSQNGFFQFSREAVVAFRHAEIKKAVDIQISAIRKSIGKAAIDRE